MSRNNLRRNAVPVTQGREGIYDDPFYNLNIAIVEFAASDYRRLCTKRKKIKNKSDEILSIDYEIKQIEKFFTSDWCFALSGGTNIAILERLQKELEE